MLAVPGRHPDLHRIIVLHARREHLRECRAFVLHVLGVTGGLCWIAADWPDAVPGLWNTIISVAWPLGFLAFLVVVFLEFRVGTLLSSTLASGDQSEASGPAPSNEATGRADRP